MKKAKPSLLVLFSFVLNQLAFAQPSLETRGPNDQPKTFGMILGISKYKYVRPLTFADKDAELFRDYLKSPAGGSVKPGDIFSLFNEQATNTNFWIKGFQWLRSKQLRKGDRLFIYMAGHGDALDENQFFFLGYDCNPGGDKNNYLVGGAIQLFNLKLKIATETAKGVEVFFIMDACRSNELPGGVKGQQSLSNAITEKKAGEIIMLAASAGQASLEDASIGNGNGLFTYYLVNGLSGIADSFGVTDYRVSLAEIEEYVQKNVPAIAQSQFKRRQEPYFCCEDKRDYVISQVDTAYLRSWLKKNGRKGPGNSFSGNPETDNRPYADTSLQEAYDLFTKAIGSNRITGPGSAEEIYSIMEKNYPANPYTLDAKSSLAVELVNFAQARVNQYLDCGQATEFEEAGNRLEKAINLLKQDEPEFSSSYLSRLFFLRSSRSFTNAHAALALDPQAAFINNQLALLHQAGNNKDSALYYAKRTVAAAPGWKCGFSTLSSIYRSMGLKDSTRKYEPSTGNKKVPGLQVGGFIGAGISNPVINLSNWDQRTINYNDSLTKIVTGRGSKFEAGMFLQFYPSSVFSIRPAMSVSFDNMDLFYHRKSPAGAIIIENVYLKTASLLVSLPAIIQFKGNKVRPYLMAAPAVYFLLNQDAVSKSKLPLKPAGIQGIAGAGMDIRLPGFTISPELGFSGSLSNQADDIDNLYTNTISSLKKQSFAISIYIKK